MAPPVLFEIVRGELVESVHRGSFVLLDASGAVSVGAGDVDRPVYVRSTVKPLQAAAMLHAGLRPDTDALALACASHDGSQLHRAGVRAALDASGATETDLRCPPDLPLGEQARIEYLAAGGEPASVCHNCSGKHAAMVATCRTNGWDVAGYLAPSAALQVAVAEYLEAACSTSIAASSIDGCGAPAHALALPALARGFATLARADGGTLEGATARAMRGRPELVGGPDRPVTRFLAGVDGLICKDGAEGMWAAALPDGRAFAAKIADGSSRGLPVLFAAVLRHWGLDVPVGREYESLEVLGGGAPVGRIQCSDAMRDLLAS